MWGGCWGNGYDEYLIDPYVAGIVQAIEGNQLVDRYAKLIGYVCAGVA